MQIYNIVIAGVGGQGVLLASKVLAESALSSGLDVKQNEVHGMAQRGGSVISFVRIGDQEVPVITVENWQTAETLSEHWRASARRSADLLRAS